MKIKEAKSYMESNIIMAKKPTTATSAADTGGHIGSTGDSDLPATESTSKAAGTTYLSL
jgi:hypothetical protein